MAKPVWDSRLIEKNPTKEDLSWKDARNFQNRAGNDDFQNNRDDEVWAFFFIFQNFCKRFIYYYFSNCIE